MKKIFFEKMFSHQLFQTNASKGVYKNDIEGLEKKTKTILLENSFSQNIIMEILSIGVHEKHMKKREKLNKFSR